MTPSPAPNFDRVARIYRWAEYLTLGPLLQRTRTRLLADLPLRHHALVLGDGDGRFLARLLNQQPNLHALAVDTSATMLLLLRNRCHAAADRLSALHTSALTLTPAPETDLVVTHFFLDCLTQPQLDALTRHFAAHLRPGALWLLSDFGHPTPRLLRPLADLYIRGLYLAFRILTGLRVQQLPDPQTALAASGFQRIQRHTSCFGLLYAELWRKR
ncbi:MAG: class I SAM-dependent methyltransferase [Acidobacteria bacterium]|nr:class I SAM-dependent methyltransferase [Acidobacteriota bacterium]